MYFWIVLPRKTWSQIAIENPLQMSYMGFILRGRPNIAHWTWNCGESQLHCQGSVNIKIKISMCPKYKGDNLFTKILQKYTFLWVQITLSESLIPFRCGCSCMAQYFILRQQINFYIYMFPWSDTLCTLHLKWQQGLPLPNNRSLVTVHSHWRIASATA